MQTFLPYTSFSESAKCLDFRRLGKQRVEAKQLINAIESWHNDNNAKVGWINHPAAIMWRRFLPALKIYHDVIIKEWISRGYKNTMPFIHPADHSYIVDYPDWLTEEFCAAHRSNLLRKDPIYYGKFGWTEPNDLPYIWPK